MNIFNHGGPENSLAGVVVPITAQTGDTIALMDGSPLAYVLRSSGMNNRWTLVGTAWFWHGPPENGHGQQPSLEQLHLEVQRSAMRSSARFWLGDVENGHHQRPSLEQVRSELLRSSMRGSMPRDAVDTSFQAGIRRRIHTFVFTDWIRRISQLLPSEAVHGKYNYDMLYRSLLSIEGRRDMPPGGEAVDTFFLI